MKITTKLVIDMTTGQVLEHEHYEYGGPITQCKGGNSKAEMQRANRVSDQQNALGLQNMGIAGSIFGVSAPGAAQNGMSFGGNPGVLGLTNQIIANNGLLPSFEQAMRANGMNQLQQFDRNAIASLNQSMAARGVLGGMNAGGGAFGQGFGMLEQGLGQQYQNLNNNIWNMKMQSLEDALGRQQQIGQMYGNWGMGYNSGGLESQGQAVQAANNADQAQMEGLRAWTGLGGQLLGGFTQGFGNTFGRQVGTGLSNLLFP